MPGTDFFDRRFAEKVALLANDELAEVSRRNKGRFYAAANVPLKFPEFDVRELRRICLGQPLATFLFWKYGYMATKRIL